MAVAAQQIDRVDRDAEALLRRTLGECEEHAGRVKDLLRLAEALVVVLPAERRMHYAQSIARFRSVARPIRRMPLNDNIVAIVAEKQELTAADVRVTLVEQGVAVDEKRVNNSLDYLARSGQIARIARGRYRITDDGEATAAAVERALADQYGPLTYRGHRPGTGWPPDD